MTDTSGASVEASVGITVAQNKAPMPIDDWASADPAVALDILGNDNDPEERSVDLGLVRSASAWIG